VSVVNFEKGIEGFGLQNDDEMLSCRPVRLAPVGQP
jgi:hypothetical protein